MILVGSHSARKIDEQITNNIDKYRYDCYRLRKLIYRVAFEEYETEGQSLHLDWESFSGTRAFYETVSDEYNRYRKRRNIDKKEFFSNIEIKYIMFGYFLGIHSLSGFEKRQWDDITEYLINTMIDDDMISSDDFDNLEKTLRFELIHVVLCKTNVNYQIHAKGNFQYYTKKQLTVIDEDKYLDPNTWIHGPDKFIPESNYNAFHRGW
jgi:hypothetical protein